jgi:ubiquinone/menaquinone biosynthesis C-methylase UbiE
MGNTDKFEMIANNYDTSERIHIASRSANAIRDYLVDTKGKSAMDFGCGTGLVGLDLADEFKTVIFLDTSQNMINVVKEKFSDHGVKNASTLCLDFESEQEFELHVDYVFMAQVLLHIQDYRSLLSKLYDVLNDEGHLLIIDFDKNAEVVSDIVHNGFDQEQLKETMSVIGYKDIHVKTFYQGNKIFMGKDASMFILDAKK